MDDDLDARARRAYETSATNPQLWDGLPEDVREEWRMWTRSQEAKRTIKPLFDRRMIPKLKEPDRR